MIKRKIGTMKGKIKSFLRNAAVSYLDIQDDRWETVNIAPRKTEIAKVAPREMSDDTRQSYNTSIEAEYRCNPFMNCLIESYKIAAIPNNIKIKALAKNKEDNEFIQRVIDDLWYNPANGFAKERVRDLARDLLLHGELCLPVGIARNGYVVVGDVDVRSISNVYWANINSSVPIGIEYKSSWLLDSNNEEHDTEKEVTITKTVVNTYATLLSESLFNPKTINSVKGKFYPTSKIAVDIAKEYTDEVQRLGRVGFNRQSYLFGECFYFRINSAPRGRGAPYFYALHQNSEDSWVKDLESNLRKMLNNIADQTDVSWDVTVDKKTEAEIKTIAQLLEDDPPTSHSVNVHSSNIKWDKVVNTANNLNSASEGILSLKSVIMGAGAGMPDILTGGSRTEARSSAAESLRQTFLRARYIQEVVLDHLKDIIQFAIDQACWRNGKPASIDRRFIFENVVSPLYTDTEVLSNMHKAAIIYQMVNNLAIAAKNKGIELPNELEIVKRYIESHTLSVGDTSSSNTHTSYTTNRKPYDIDRGIILQG